MSHGSGGDPRLWRRAQEVFEAVVDLDPDGRRQRLESLAREDSDLAWAVSELLAADQATNDPRLDRPVWSTTLAMIAGAERRGERLGPYRLGALLGAGGMGEVYAAERADGEYRQGVAIKLLPPLAGSASIERFRRERQILADLAHPSIATLLDGGVVDGRPFLVMERVDGPSLTEFCRRQRTRLDERLALLAKVADAVAHAHRRGVVHRDLKPQNILVNPDGLPKLLDFGIAELMVESGVGSSGGSGLLASQRLSPGYCAPEQLAGHPAGPAADVFSLGVVLFELLTDHRPFEGPWGSLDELRRAMESGPPRLVEGLGQGGDPARHAAACHATPRQLERWLAGDLQAVVDRALHPEPARRYAGASALAEDLGRWRDRQPILARPATLGYRLRKLVARRTAVVVAVAVACLAVLLATGSQWSRQRQRLVAEGLEKRADHTVEILLDVVRLAEPAERLGRPLTPEEVLARGEARARSELAEAPVARAQILATLADGYRETGDLRKAGLLAEEALALRRQALGDGGGRGREVALAESLDQLGEIRRLQGLFEPAETLGREALALWRSLDGVAPGVVAHSLDHLAETLHELGRYAAAEPLYRESLALRQSDLGAEHPLVAESLAHLGLLLKNRGQPEDALALYREALALRQRVLPPGHPEIAESLYLVGTMEGFLGRRDEARGDLEAAAELHRQIYGETHPKTLLVLHDLGCLLADLGQHEEAEPLLRRVLAERQNLYPDPHPELAQSYTALSALLFHRGDLEGARQLLGHSVEINRQLFGPHHPYVLSDLLSLALFENQLGQPEQAEVLLRRALEGYRQAVEPTHRDLCRALTHLGDTASRLGGDDAGALLVEGRDCFRRASGEDDPATRRAEEKLAEHRRRLAEGAGGSETGG